MATFAQEVEDGVIPWIIAGACLLITIVFILKHSAVKRRRGPAYYTVRHGSEAHQTLSYHATRESVAWALVTCLLLVSLGMAIWVITESTSGYTAYFDTVPASSEYTLDCSGNGDAYDVNLGQATNLCIFTGDVRTGHGVSEETVAEMCNSRRDCEGYHVSHSFPYSTPCDCTLGEEGSTVTGACPHCVSTAGTSTGAPVYRLVGGGTKLQSVGPSVYGADRDTRVTTYMK